MAGLNTTYNVCPGCGAAVGARAAACALCDAQLPRATRRSASQRTPQTPDTLPAAQQRVWRELAPALSPSIRIVGYLAEGGMGSVFLGYDVALKREVAVKVLALELAEDDVARERFKREAEAAGGVSHPNVVAIHQVGELATSHVPYFVMQYVDGPTLQHAVVHRRLLSEARVRRILRDVASGLAAAHRRGVVHRDIKPNNIVLDAETGRALVLDFGIVAALDVRRSSGATRLTTEGMYIGTPMYMSPEQAGTGEVTDRSDIYSLAVVAFELLTGRPPFLGRNPMTLMASHLRDAPPRVDTLRADVSTELASLLDRCLAKEPADRPGAQALVDFFDPDAAATIAWPPPGLERGRGIGSRFVAILAMMGATLLLFLTLLHAWTPAGPLQQGGERTLLGVSAVMVFVLVGLAIGTGARVARVVARGRRAGYPWPVIAEVLGDRWRDTDTLLNGRGRYALTDDETRRRFTRLRGMQGMLLLAGAALSLLVPVLWLSGAFARGASGSELVTRGELLALALPPLLLAAAGLLCSIPEARWRRRNAATTVAGPLAPDVRAEVVSSWLQASRRGIPAPSRAAHGPLILGLVILASGAVMATVALPLAAVLLSSTLRVQTRPATVELTRWLDAGAPPAAAGTDMSDHGMLAGMPTLFADPAAPAGRRHMTPASLPATVRAMLPMQVAAGMCMNARELLFGGDRRRIDLVRMTPALVDPRGELATARTNARAAGEWLAASGLRDRIRRCSAFLRM